jgi:hypothetical protein
VKSPEQIELRKKLMRRLIWKAPLIIALVSFAAWWQLKHNTERGANKESTAANSQLVSMLTGSWAADVTYSSGARQREEFFFQPEGDKLYGTASYLGSKRGIEDGRIAGLTISFSVSFEEVLNETTRLRRNRYEGRLVGDVVQIKLFDDAGNPPLEFTLAKSRSASGGSAAAQ